MGGVNSARRENLILIKKNEGQMDGMSLSLEEVNSKVHDDIEKYGWSVLAAEHDEGMMYVHTIGLETSFDHPELEVLGLSEELSTTFLNELSQWIKRGMQLENGMVISELVEGYKFILVMNPSDPDGPPITNGYLRLIWPDSNHFYPWESDCEESCLFQTQLIDPSSVKVETLV